MRRGTVPVWTARTSPRSFAKLYMLERVVAMDERRRVMPVTMHLAGKRCKGAPRHADTPDPLTPLPARRIVLGMTRKHVASVGANVRAEMTRQGFTQEQVGAALGVSQSGISRRLLGAIAFDVTELTILARLFGVPASHLLGENAAA